VEYDVGDIVKLSTDCDGRAGKVLEVEGALVTVGWTNGSKTVFSALVLERLSCELPPKTAGIRWDDGSTKRIPSNVLDRILLRRSKAIQFCRSGLGVSGGGVK